MLRPATPGDRPDLIARALAEDAAWSDAPAVSEDEVGEFLDRYGTGVIAERGGRAAGYAAVDEGGWIDPARRPGRPRGSARRAGRLARRARAARDRRVRGRRAADLAWLEEHGFSHLRSTFDLERAIDPPPAPAVLPSGVAVTRYRPGEDVTAPSTR